MERKQSPQPTVTMEGMIDRLSLLGAHLNGDHAETPAEGCPDCEAREALWSAVVTGRL
jgi:hypothetical protein